MVIQPGVPSSAASGCCHHGGDSVTPGTPTICRVVSTVCAVCSQRSTKMQRRGGEERLHRRKSSDQGADASNSSGWQARGGFNFLLHNSIIFQFFLNE